jgi:hypothetical protein
MVTHSDNRVRLAPVSEGVHRPLWSVMIFHILLRGFCIRCFCTPLRQIK